MRCEGYIRYGGAFTLGPVKWIQCKNEAVVSIKFKGGKSDPVKVLPACMDCWKECIESKDIEILEVKPLDKEIKADSEDLEEENCSTCMYSLNGKPDHSNEECVDCGVGTTRFHHYKSRRDK